MSLTVTPREGNDLIGALKDAVESLQTAVTGLQTAVTDLTARVEALEQADTTE